MPDLFAKLIGRVLVHEAGYVDHPNDPGGATNLGITERVARAWGYKGDMRDLPRATAEAIYRAQYWATIRGDELPAALAFQVLDAAVNHGPDRAARWLQGVVGAAQDGKIGPVTLVAAANADLPKALIQFNQMRLEFMAGLRHWQSFGRGWARRVAGNLQYAAEDLKA